MDKDLLNILLQATNSGGGGGGEDLPEHAAADDGKVLTVQDDGSLAWQTPDAELPAHTASDAGKVPVVQDDNSLAWETPSGGMTVPYVAFTATETISDKVFWTRTLTASEEAAWAGVDWRSPGQLFVFNVNKATLNAADRRGNFVIRDSNGDLLVKGYIWTEGAYGYLNGAVLTSNTGAASHSFVVACTMAASNSQAIYVTSYELPSTKAYAGKVLTVDANDVAQWMDAGIKQTLTKAWSGKISVGSTAKTSTATRKEMILNRDFHGYVFEHAITGAIAADDECTFADFYIPEGCHEVYIYTKADGESSWEKRKQIKNIKPYKVGVADTEYLSWDGDNPQMIVYHDFTTTIGAALAEGDKVRTVFIQDPGLDLDAYTAAHGVPTHAAADAGKVPVVQQDGSLAWQTPSGGGAATEVAAPIPAQWGSAFDFYFADTSDGNLGPNEIALDGTFDINADRVGVHAYGDNTLSEALTLTSGTTYELYFRECPVLPKIAVLKSTEDPTDPSSYSQIVHSSNITFKAWHGDRMEFAATFTPSSNISLAQGEAFEVLLIP